jgi:NADPH:quinone reductase-like Zn-dependent oxidoreductase
VLTPQGIYVGIGGGGPNEQGIIGPLWSPIKMMFLSPFISQQLQWFAATIKPSDIVYVRDLMEAGKLKPVIDKTYPLTEIAAAMRYLEAGHARGKVIVDVD